MWKFRDKHFVSKSLKKSSSKEQLLKFGSKSWFQGDFICILFLFFLRREKGKVGSFDCFSKTALHTERHYKNWKPLKRFSLCCVLFLVCFCTLHLKKKQQQKTLSFQSKMGNLDTNLVTFILYPAWKRPTKNWFIHLFHFCINQHSASVLPSTRFMFD